MLASVTVGIISDNESSQEVMQWKKGCTGRSRLEKEEDFAPKGRCAPQALKAAWAMQAGRGLSSSEAVYTLAASLQVEEPSAALSRNHWPQGRKGSAGLTSSRRKQKQKEQRGPRENAEHEDWKQRRECGPLHRFIYKKHKYCHF